jgi:Protein of unknown function (DUF3108)
MPARRLPFPLLPSNRRQWLAVGLIALIVAVHLALIDWANDSLALIRALDEEDDPVIVELHAPAGKAAVVPTPARPAKQVPERVAPMVPAIPAAPPASAPNPAPDSPATAETATAPAETPAAPSAATTQPQPQETEPVASTPSAPVVESTPLFERVSFPPSAELSYDALATQGSRRLSGSGTILWQASGTTYLIKGEASALLLNLLSYQSSGQIGGTGLMPEQYQEKRIGKSATTTHFVRERKTISFSASTQLHEIRGGEQDRGSVIWQLAGLARGDPDKLAAGLGFEAVIAGSKAADRWNVIVVGRESVTLAEGSVTGWHLSLAPVENNFDYQIDLWLSPDRDWYPVRINYSNRSGASLSLSLSRVGKK